MPEWLDKNEVNRIASKYELAKYLSEETGIPWHVDHIIPLQGENVCGLHVPWNLRVIPAYENTNKRNTIRSL